MSFFNKLKDPNNEITYSSGKICKRLDTQVEDFVVSDNLRGVRYIILSLKISVLYCNISNCLRKV